MLSKEAQRHLQSYQPRLVPFLNSSCATSAQEQQQGETFVGSEFSSWDSLPSFLHPIRKGLWWAWIWEGSGSSQTCRFLPSPGTFSYSRIWRNPVGRLLESWSIPKLPVPVDLEQPTIPKIASWQLRNRWDQTAAEALRQLPWLLQAFQTQAFSPNWQQQFLKY